MKKIISLTFFFVIFASAYLCAQFQVQVTALAEKIPVSYFADLDGVSIERDVNNLYRVYTGNYATAKDAEAAVADLKSKGYKYARVIDMEELSKLCSGGCKEPLYVRNIFFDYDRSNLRSVSRRDLDKLASLMKDNAGYRVDLTAHTDAHGSDEYNVALSQRRADSAQSYLIQKGIASERITTGHSGEISPIAKNVLASGADSPTGRQFNRRVEITVIAGDGKVVPNVVEPIRVPDELKI